MITVLVMHIMAEESRPQAEALIKRNTEDAKHATGFISRRILYSVEEPLRCYSVTSWECMADLENFHRRPNRPHVEVEGDDRRIYEEISGRRTLLFTHSRTEICEES